MSWDNIRLALDQKVSGVTGDQTSPWDRATLWRHDQQGNLHVGQVPAEMGGVFTRWGESMAQSTDHPLLHNPDGTARSFRSLSPGQQAAVSLRIASNVVGGLFGALNLVQDALNVGFANLTAPLAAIWPSMPAATMTMLYVGAPHAHGHPPSFIAPAPPVPLPS